MKVSQTSFPVTTGPETWKNWGLKFCFIYMTLWKSLKPLWQSQKARLNMKDSWSVWSYWISVVVSTNLRIIPWQFPDKKKTQGFQTFKSPRIRIGCTKGVPCVTPVTTPTRISGHWGQLHMMHPKSITHRVMLVSITCKWVQSATCFYHSMFLEVRSHSLNYKCIHFWCQMNCDLSYNNKMNRLLW